MTPAEVGSAIPLTVLTGFLGSGKTTLLARLLAHPELAGTAVLINEFGEVGLDHLLVRHVAENVVLLPSGCVCCAVQGDLVRALRALFLDSVRDAAPVRRVVIETSGLADPAPVLHTLIRDPLLGARYRLDGVVATADAVGLATALDRHAETAKQLAVADRIVLTKTDIATPEAVAAATARIARLNPAAPVIIAVKGAVAPAALFEAGLFNARDRTPDPTRWLNAAAYRDHHHDSGIASFAVAYDAPLVWEDIVTALEALTAAHGERLLRLKGILCIAGRDRPLAVHGVQHLFHPPAELPAWPDADRRSRLVFITRGLARSDVEAVLNQAIARP